MCGIVGYVGKGEAQSFLLSGLKRLEYRGYDSAGIVTISSDGAATLIRAKGKISNLEESWPKIVATTKLVLAIHVGLHTVSQAKEMPTHIKQVAFIWYTMALLKTTKS